MIWLPLSSQRQSYGKISFSNLAQTGIAPGVAALEQYNLITAIQDNITESVFPDTVILMANVRIILFQIYPEEGFHLVVWNHSGNVVVEIHMGGTRDYHQLLVSFDGALTLDVAAGHALKCILAEIAAVGLLAVDEENGSLDFSRPGQKRLVQEALATDDVPAILGVAAALVIAARGLMQEPFDERT